MSRYWTRRLLYLVLVVLGVITLTFVVSHLIPADPARYAAGLHARPEQVELVRKQLGLDRPVWEQYVRYIARLCRGDLGTSILTRKPVAEELKLFFPATAELVLVALLLNVLIAVPLGVAAAVGRGRPTDGFARLLAVIGAGMPVFWLGLILQLLLYARWNVLPMGGRLSVGVLPPPQVTGLYVVDAILAGQPEVAVDALRHLIMPSFVLAIGEIAVVTRMTRSSMLEVLGQDYIRTARAKGLAERVVIYRHALKNAILPVVTVLGMQLGWMMGGTLLVESIFSWGGLGYYAVTGIRHHDFPVIMGVTLLISVTFVVANLIVDFLYTVLDPRIRY
ncbi:MAG: ABC transporter permease [Bacillota bacterium]